MDILKDLNPAQREAVESIEGPVLVLAGPGSGKTRVLTQRVGYLVHVCGINPYNIMAVTFTNKAAREMKERLHRLLGERLRRLTIGTFHAICVRILRREAEEAGLPKSFVIYDDGDQLGLIRQALKDLDLDDKMYQPRAVQGAISRAKNELVLPENYVAASYWHEVAGRVYHRYQELLSENDALDFDDILMFTARLFAQHRDVLAKYQRRYIHILVDEFQDTNMAQYELVKKLAGQHHNLFAVADEDQSIYSWRGADFRNVRRFREDYPEAKCILLERNYRSTQTILDVANAVIVHNVQRTAKRLYTERDQGLPVTVFEAYNEQEEGSYIVEEIQRLATQGLYRPGDCAVMYRTNAQSRAIEDAFVWHGMPYKLVGATRFYQRREIKDLLAYLRLIHNPYDSVSLSRIINVPPRGIGAKTIATLEQWTNNLNVPLYMALQILKKKSPLPPLSGGDRGGEPDSSIPFGTRACKALLEFLNLLEELIAAREERDVLGLLDLVLQKSGYEEYIKDGTKEGEERWDNIMELRTVAAEYATLPLETSLTTFLEEVALVSDVDNLDEEVDASTLLTLHSAKGLEFPVVFIAGIDEGLLPHSRSFGDAEAMEEERRLCYVGITRAKDRLYLVYTFRRALHGYDERSVPSRYLKDIPIHLIKGAEEIKPQPTDLEAVAWSVPSAANVTQPSELPSPPAPQFKTGDRVRHPKFGYGTVIESKIVGTDEEVVVAFEEKGIKRLMVSFAHLDKVDG